MASHNNTNALLDLKAFGNNVYQARNKLQLTQQELATMIHKSAKTIQNIESGESDTSISTALRISEALAEPLYRLLNLAEGSAVHNIQNNQQDGHVNILNSGTMSAEKEAYELRIAEFKERLEDKKAYIATLEQTIHDLREDKARLMSQK